MKHELPIIKNTPVIPIGHFPTRMQCFIFRNWEMIEPRVLGEVFGCDAETVTALAAEMGLPTPPSVDPAWLSKGYITIIRANWHLLDYDALCGLLEWTPDQLSFILREDDFLEVKLGRFKPAVPDFHVRPLTENEVRRTAEIRAAFNFYKKQMRFIFANDIDLQMTDAIVAV